MRLKLCLRSSDISADKKWLIKNKRKTIILFKFTSKGTCLCFVYVEELCEAAPTLFQYKTFYKIYIEFSSTKSTLKLKLTFFKNIDKD